MTKVQWPVNVDGEQKMHKGFVQGYVFVPNSGIVAIVTTMSGVFVTKPISDIFEVRSA